MTAPQKAQWKTWLDDEDLRLWYENQARGSLSGALGSIRVFYRYCQRAKTTPQEILALARTDMRRVENQLMALVGALEKEGRSPNYTKHFVESVKSWLNFNGLGMVRRIKIAHKGATPTLEDERVPIRDELRAVYNNATPRGRVICGAIAQGGLRPKVLGDQNAQDGLVLGDLVDLRIDGKVVVFDKVPCRVNVRANLSKARHAYFTFFAKEECDFIKAYLEQRLAAGEEMTPKTALVRCTPGWEAQAVREGRPRSQFITSDNVSREVHEAMRPRFPWRPYVLRCYFDTQLLLAESNGLIPQQYRNFFMGHTGTMSARYTVNKGRLPSELVEDMRTAYARASVYLETTQAAPVDRMKRMAEVILKAAGVEPTQLAGIDVAGLDDEQVNAVLERARAVRLQSANTAVASAPAATPPVPIQTASKVRQKVVAIADIAAMLEQGWIFRASLDGGRAVIEAP